MKKFLSLTLFSFVLLSLQAQDNALRSLCLVDGYGYYYSFPSIKKSGSSFSATGTGTAYPSTTVTLSGSFTSSNGGTLTMNVVNNNPDGCNSYSDSYTYTGSFTYGSGGGTGSGTWVNYCNGSSISSGTWTASTSTACKLPTQRLAPNGPAAAKNKAGSIIKILPNPAVSQAQVYYSVTSTAKVSVIVYNNMQQHIATLVNETKTIGSYSTNWNLLSSNGTSVQNGIYTAVIKIGANTYTRQIQVLR